MPAGHYKSLRVTMDHYLMTGQPLIRRACIEDTEQIEALVSQAYEPYIARIGRKPAPMLDDYRQVVAENDVFVATVEAEIVGVIVKAPQATELLLVNVAVSPKFKGQGIVKVLMAYCEAHARSTGSHTIRLYTHELMTENIEIYNKLGYQETHRASENGFARVFMAKALGNA
jgi:ribosomal protein S18 acetylase RimI-like enzyme